MYGTRDCLVQQHGKGTVVVSEVEEFTESNEMDYVRRQ